ncbi:MAG: hypothetical protein Q7S22_04535 [Candidatus Micrarchaeota archaeon]|nr:hypothetical protein [Candidatus Micrarchaeota archaeon]
MTTIHKPRMRVLDVTMPNGKAAYVGIFRKFTGEALPFVEGLVAVERFNGSHGTHLALISNPVSQALLAVHSNIDALLACCSYPLRTFAGHDKRGIRLKSEIVSTEGEHLPRVILPTKQHRGRTALLHVIGLRSADIKKDGNDLVVDVPEKRLVAVPIRMKPKEGEAGRDKLPDFSYVGPLFQNVYVQEHGEAYLDTNHLRIYSISDNRNTFGVLVEIPEVDLAKFQLITRSRHLSFFAVLDVQRHIVVSVNHIRTKTGGAFVTFDPMLEFDSLARTGTDSR